VAQARGRDPHDKRIIASDALDVDDILGLHAYFGGALASGVTSTDFRSAADFTDRRKWTPGRRIRFSAGWGTLLTNDFRGCDPAGGGDFDPISLICKVSDVEGNYSKAPRREALRQLREGARHAATAKHNPVRNRAVARRYSPRLHSAPMASCMPCQTTRLRMAARSAPRAMRMPISWVRCWTE
jgi:nicotinic acid phosphoribosyltransferase